MKKEKIIKWYKTNTKELGIEVNVLLKALINGIKTKDKKYQAVMVCINHIDNKHYLFYRDAIGMYYRLCYLKDYKKTWWILTKKEIKELQ